MSDDNVTANEGNKLTRRTFIRKVGEIAFAITLVGVTQGALQCPPCGSGVADSS
jgi:hypothetical protein